MSADPPRLTVEQSRPLHVRGASVALSAGAGCGKTTVLTSRFLAALDSDNNDGDAARRPLGALVALTFTEKAARELRKRIREECYHRFDASTGDETIYWRSVLRGLEAAPVSTFHEFCAAMLRRHAIDAGIDPDFQILDATMAGALREESLSKTLRGQLASRNHDLIELAVEYGLRSVRESIATLVSGQGVAELSTWAICSESEVLSAWHAFWNNHGRPALAAPLLKAAENGCKWFAANDFDHPRLQAMRSALLDDLPTLATRDDPAWLVEVRERAKVPGGLRANHWPSPEINTQARSVLETLRNSIDAYIGKSTIDEAVSLRSASHGLMFARLARDARIAYDEAKRSRGGLDFDDLLTRTRDLLRQRPELATSLGQSVEFLLVDEFQDTDPIQAEILRALGGDDFARGRLFIVGDFKQSIYRFRGARPQLFQEIRAEFPAIGRHNLTENFRSSVGVIDFVNALFADAFPGETPRLVPGPASTPAADLPSVEFVWADESDVDDSQKLNAEEMRRVEARWLARLVKSRLDAGWAIRDRRTKAVRNAGENDVAFLFRAMTDLAPYESALQAEGLDFHVVGGKAFYAQQEVFDLTNVLSVIEDPVDTVALAGALRGPFFGLSDDALFWLGTASGDLADGLERLADVVGLSDLDLARARRALALLHRWRDQKDRLPIADLVDRVLDESGFEPSLLGEFLGDRKRANARKLVRLARRFDARGGFTLGHFVQRLRDDLRRPPREEQAATTEEEGKSVRLMSIHQSKGLEFPIVIVPDLNRKQAPPRQGLAFHPDLGPLVRPAKTTPGDGATDDDNGSGCSLGWVAFEAVERLEDEAESIRLFYVATTRARDALILSAGLASGARPISAPLRLLDARFDRDTGACLAPLPEGWPVPTVQVITECPPRTHITTPRPRRPRLKAVARVIDSAATSTLPLPSVAEPRRPRFVDLDAERRLSPRAERLDRLLRSILLDPNALRPGRLAEVARRAGSRQIPVASPDLVEEVARWLAPWINGPIGADLLKAAVIVRGKEWAVVQDGTVFQGRTDFFARDSNGRSRAVNFEIRGASRPIERLRLLLSARATEAPIHQGILIRLDDGICLEDDFSEAVIKEAVADVFPTLNRS